MKNQVSALIVARPGQLRDSLQVLLAAIPRVKMVRPASDVPSALAVDTPHRPALVVLDSDLETLQQVKIVWPQTLSIVLIDHEHQRQAAQSAGADVVLIKGVLAARLFATVEELLSRQKHD